MTFLDTSAVYALADGRDPAHRLAKECFAALLDAGKGILTHNYVVLESIALLQHRLGLAVALEFADAARAFEVAWVDAALHDEALGLWKRAGLRRVSLVDQVSFLVMRRHEVDTAFAFDPDFEREGFQLYRP